MCTSISHQSWAWRMQETKLKMNLCASLRQRYIKKNTEDEQLLQTTKMKIMQIESRLKDMQTEIENSLDEVRCNDSQYEVQKSKCGLNVLDDEMRELVCLQEKQRDCQNNLFESTEMVQSLIQEEEGYRAQFDLAAEMWSSYGTI